MPEVIGTANFTMQKQKNVTMEKLIQIYQHILELMTH